MCSLSSDSLAEQRNEIVCKVFCFSFLAIKKKQKFTFKYLARALMRRSANALMINETEHFH